MEAFYNPAHAPLSGEELKNAVSTQVKNFTQVVRSERDPKLEGMNFVGVSNIIFDEPKQLRDGGLAYGYFKVRCVGNTVDDVQRQAEKIVSEIDSKNPVLIAPMGAWMPITTSKDAIQEVVSVGSTQKQVDEKFSDDSVRKARADEKRKQKEIEDRKKELQKGDVYDKPESIDMYIMKRNVDVHLYDEISQLERKLKNLRYKQDLTRRALHKLDSQNPTYLDEWVEKYNENRKKSGLPNFVPNPVHVISYETEYRRNNQVSDQPIEKLLDDIIRA